MGKNLENMIVPSLSTHLEGINFRSTFPRTQVFNKSFMRGDLSQILQPSGFCPLFLLRLHLDPITVNAALSRRSHTRMYALSS